MAPGRANAVRIAAISLLIASSGCAQNGPFLGRRTTIGTLKTSVAQLEHENDEIRANLAKLETERQQLAEQLAQEREESGELSARLDDARALLARQGLDGSRQAASDPLDAEFIPPPRDSGATPVVRPRSTARKPPFAQIGGGERLLIDADPDSAPPYQEPPPSDPDLFPPPAQGSSAPRRRPAEEPMRWLPVATGAADSTPRR